MVNLMTVEEVAAYWRIKPDTVRKKYQKGELPFAQRQGRRLLFNENTVKAFTYRKGQ